MRMLAPLVLVFAIAASASSSAEQYKPLAGTFAIVSKTQIDPPPGETKDRISLYLQGDSAREAFEAMPSQAERDLCDPDVVTKYAGGLSCSKSDAGEYGCSVAILLTTGVTANAQYC